jgi:Bacterial extracellular solute-binding protein
LKVIISGGFAGAYEQLLPDFERTSGIKVTTGSGSSQGTGPQTIGAQLARGVAADVVILSREGLNELIAENRIAAGTDVDLAQSPLGVAVRAGAPKPDLSTVEAVKQVLLKAKTIALYGSPVVNMWKRFQMPVHRTKGDRSDRSPSNALRWSGAEGAKARCGPLGRRRRGHLIDILPGVRDDYAGLLRSIDSHLAGSLRGNQRHE